MKKKMTGAAAKTDHDRILEVPLRDISPNPINDKIYRPIDSEDPDWKAFVENVMENGQLTPMVLSSDFKIISGHRRYAALFEINAPTAKAIVKPIASDDPRMEELLVAYNSQREKSADEKIREAIVQADPDDAYEALSDERKKRARIEPQGNAFAIEGSTSRSEISDAKAPFLDAIKNVIAERKDFWPLTDRQIHYALLNAPPLRHASKPRSRYANDKQSYRDLCDLVARARLSGNISFEVITDSTRPITVWKVSKHIGPFVKTQVDSFLKGYWRDLLQSQPNQIEILGEKNTIGNIINPVAAEFCIPVTLGRGYSSIPPRYAMAQRFERSGKEKLVLLILSDFDPEGEDIAHSYARSMRDEFGIRNVLPIKVALNADQVAKLHLPPQMKAKEGSSRRKRFVDRHGEHVYELEAIPPKMLQSILREAIESVLDMEAYNAEIRCEKEDATKLVAVRETVLQYLKSHVSSMG